MKGGLEGRMSSERVSSTEDDVPYVPVRPSEVGVISLALAALNMSFADQTGDHVSRLACYQFNHTFIFFFP